MLHVAVIEDTVQILESVVAFDLKMESTSTVSIANILQIGNPVDH
jgi:hypothetical protein